MLLVSFPKSSKTACTLLHPAQSSYCPSFGLQAEQNVYPRSHNKAGLVSLIVEDAGPRCAQIVTMSFIRPKFFFHSSLWRQMRHRNGKPVCIEVSFSLQKLLTILAHSFELCWVFQGCQGQISSL